MKSASAFKPQHAFTLLEVLVVVLVIVVLAALILPVNLGHGRNRAGIVACINNTRQILLGTALYQADFTNQVPWQAFLQSASAADQFANVTAAAVFLNLTNYLKDPKVFVCPTEHLRTAARSFEAFGNTNVSYFLAVTPPGNSPLQILVGERHLTLNQQALRAGLVQFASTTKLGWSWELHEEKVPHPSGALGFADGHAEFVRSESLALKFASQSLATNRLLLP